VSKIYKSVDELIGKTPLAELTNIERELKLEAKLLAKLEFFNPAGSVKDRVAKSMIDETINRRAREKIFKNVAETLDDDKN
jgi:cysteine synthase A